MIVELEVPGRPVPKGRPRVVNGRAFTPKRTREHEEWIAWECRRRRVRLQPGTPVMVEIQMYVASPLRGDLDNYAKAVLDGLEKGEAIANDRDVVGLTVRPAIVVDDPDHERTVIKIETRGAA